MEKLGTWEKPLTRILWQQLGAIKGQRILDFGSGYGVTANHFAKENEALWNIGKKYRVSLNKIREVNQLDSDVLRGGERILISKEMA